jgi:hypothetical protein
VGETGVVGAVFAYREMMIYDFVLLNCGEFGTLSICEDRCGVW